MAQLPLYDAFDSPLLSSPGSDRPLEGGSRPSATGPGVSGGGNASWDMSRSVSGGGGPSGGGAMSVGQVAGLVKQVLADHLPRKIRVRGEVSNLSDRTHWFFSLKDQDASLRCVCFSSVIRRLSLVLQDGMAVIATGRLDYYGAQGSLQFYVDDLEPVGKGTLQEQLRALIEQLRGLGYFDPARKKPIPRMAQRIAVVTSRSAAALQDVIHTAARRWPGCCLSLCDVRVQGDLAAAEIARAIRYLSRHGKALGIDAILLTRGGGSMEDLWAFNERIVADAIFACPLPLVAAIGHETDTTVAELVADQRCATPTQAAMILVPDRQALAHQLEQTAQRMRLALGRQSQFARQQLLTLERHPFFRKPVLLLTQPAQKLQQMDRRLASVLRTRLAVAQQRFMACDRQLQAVAPQRVLERGFSYTTDATGRILHHAKQLQPGDLLQTVLAEGTIKSRVVDVSCSQDRSSVAASQRSPRPRHRGTSPEVSVEPGLFDPPSSSHA